jgi:5-methylthioadenosine/S-adenosylhomocysteine deaminase
MGSYLLTNGYVVTVDEERRVFTDGYVEIAGDSIVAVGSMDDLSPADIEAPSGDREVVNMGGMVVMPGLINGHNHHWGSLFKNTGEGLLLEDWLDQVTIPLMMQLSPEDLRVSAYLGALEQLRTGTTCSLNHAVNTNDFDSMTQFVEPVLDVGVRQVVTKELRNTPNPPFSNLYPATPHVRDLDEEIALAESVVDKWDGAGGIVHIGLAIESGANWMLHNATSDELIREGVSLAQKRNLKITNHCSAGTPWLSIKEFEQHTGGGDVDYLVRLGALTDNWVLIHNLHLKDREIDHVARAGAGVISNPVSNAYSCDGIAPLRSMFEAGLDVGLGTDGTYVNCSPDMVEQMKFAALIQNVTHFDPTFISAERAIEMATINTAKAIGLGDLIGSLETGKRADIAVFDLNRTHITVPNRPVSALVFSAHGTDVDSVMVNGEFRIRAGELLAPVDEQEVLAEARLRARAAIEKAGIAGRVDAHWHTTNPRRIENVAS